MLRRVMCRDVAVLYLGYYCYTTGTRCLILSTSGGECGPATDGRQRLTTSFPVFFFEQYSLLLLGSLKWLPIILWAPIASTDTVRYHNVTIINLTRRLNVSVPNLGGNSLIQISNDSDIADGWRQWQRFRSKGSVPKVPSGLHASLLWFVYWGLLLHTRLGLSHDADAPPAQLALLMIVAQSSSRSTSHHWGWMFNLDLPPDPPPLQTLDHNPPEGKATPLNPYEGIHVPMFYR